MPSLALPPANIKSLPFPGKSVFSKRIFRRQAGWLCGVTRWTAWRALTLSLCSLGVHRACCSNTGLGRGGWVGGGGAEGAGAH